MLAEAIGELEEKIKSLTEELETIRHYVEKMEQDNAAMSPLSATRTCGRRGKPI